MLSRAIVPSFLRETLSPGNDWRRTQLALSVALPFGYKKPPCGGALAGFAPATDPK